MFSRAIVAAFAGGILLASLGGLFLPFLLPWLAAAASIFLAVLLWKSRKSGDFIPRSKAFKELQKMRKKQERAASDKHAHINDQIDYIDIHWGYTQQQRRTIERFLEARAYTEMYNRLSASLLPQLIALVDQCNRQSRKGCKREVSRRIRELTLLMKEELERNRSRSREGFEVTLEVYDHLLREHDSVSR
jgi:hypothetical protein